MEQNIKKLTVPAAQRHAVRPLKKFVESTGSLLSGVREAIGRRTAINLHERLEKAERANKLLEKEIKGMKTGALQFFSKSTVADAVCPACDGTSLWVSAYPYSTSPRFSRLLCLFCEDCGLGWVPDVPFDLNTYYQREYGKQNRGDRHQVDPALYFSKENPLLNRKRVRRYFQRSENQLIRAKKYVSNIDAMLDFGGGPGYALYASGARVKHAVEHDENSKKYLDFLGATRVDIRGLAPKSYDLVLSSHSLEHLHPDDLYPTLDYLRRSLKPGGVFYVEVPGGALSRYRLVTKHEPHTLFFTPGSLVAILEKAGFEIVFADTVSKIDNLLLTDPVFEPEDADVFTLSSRGQLTVIAKVATNRTPVVAGQPQKGTAKLATTYPEVRQQKAKAVEKELPELFNKNGFVLLRGFFEKEKSLELAARLREEVGEARFGDSLCDALNLLDSASAELFNQDLIATVEGVLQAPMKFLQVCDVQTDHNRDNWHRDSACRKFGTADWDETKERYRTAKAIIYLDIQRAGLAVVPGSHKIETRLGHVSNELKAYDLVRQSDNCRRALFAERPERPAMLEMGPGDVLLFDERLLHCGRRLNASGQEFSESFSYPKTTLAYVFGAENRHSWRFHSFFRHQRPELGYKPLSPKLVRELRTHGLLPKFYGKDLFAEHPEEITTLTSDRGADLKSR